MDQRVRDAVAAARWPLLDALARNVFPGACAEIGTSSGAVWSTYLGTLEPGPEAARVAPDTLWDLASLTKVIATTSVFAHLVSERRVDLDARLGCWFEEWREADRATVTVRDLLAHSSGLPAHADLYRETSGPEGIRRAIGRTPLAYVPGSRAEYSDLGFILLPFIAERVSNRTFVELVIDVLDPLTPAQLCFLPSDAQRARCAPTGYDDWRGRTLAGEAHDRNASALGGIAGHAGLFGSLEGVGAFARLVLRTLDGRQTNLATLDVMRTFVARQTTPSSSRALGWDTMLPTSSCGRFLSPDAIGHTGFTGTSLWIDWRRGWYFVLLTNRVAGAAGPDAMSAVRRAFHDALGRGLFSGE